MLLGDLNIFLAFGAGLLSSLSPCALPLYPAFLSYITGMTVDELKAERETLRKKALIHTIFFLLGFSVIFLAIGLSTSFIGTFFLTYQNLLRQLGAVILVFFGLVLTGILLLLKDKKIQFRKRPAGYLGSILIGLEFAAGWTPVLDQFFCRSDYVKRSKSRDGTFLYDFLHPGICNTIFNHDAFY